MGRALRPIPQELFFLVGWAGEPVLFIFARGLIFPAVPQWRLSAQALREGVAAGDAREELPQLLLVRIREFGERIAKI